ncbi:MAG: BREX system ATP-binding domain-containing protein [Candidatus Angelobacter sp.]
MSVKNHRSSIRRLRRGVVANSHILQLSVGIDPLIREMERQLRLLRFRTAEGFFVDGEWGTGKSHILAVLRQMAATKGFATAYINLNGNNAALNHPQRFFHLVSNRVRVNGSSGLSRMISNMTQDRSHKPKLFEWALTHRHTSELAMAIHSLIDSPDGDAQLAALATITGADLYWADYGYKREKALRRIEDMGGCLAAIGAGGLIVELDELETVDQLWNSRSRLGAYSVLGRLMLMKNVLPVFATTVRFQRVVEFDIQEGAIERCNASGQEFLRGWKKRQYPILRSIEFGPEMARALVSRVIEVYQQAYPGLQDCPNPSALVDQWIASPARTIRKLIRRVVHSCDVLAHSDRLE